MAEDAAVWALQVMAEPVRLGPWTLSDPADGIVHGEARRPPITAVGRLTASLVAEELVPLAARGAASDARALASERPATRSGG